MSGRIRSGLIGAVIAAVIWIILSLLFKLETGTIALWTVIIFVLVLGGTVGIGSVVAANKK
jgi:ABC-type multidrug transport system permease subunit